MGLVNIRFEVANDVQFHYTFETAIAKYLNLEEPFSLMANDFFQTMAFVFEVEGAIEGRKRWQDLSPAYNRWKTRHLPGRKILERKGDLRDSLISEGDSNNVLDITKDSLSVGTRLPYAMYHQTGTRKMPMRKVIELTNEQKSRWVRIMHNYMREVNKDIERMSRGGL